LELIKASKSLHSTKTTVSWKIPVEQYPKIKVKVTFEVIDDVDEK
jgi:hypothetical protein